MDAKRVTVKKVGGKYQCYAPGAAEPFYADRGKGKALSAAYTYARYKLGNQSMFLASTVNAEGFKI